MPSKAEIRKAALARRAAVAPAEQEAFARRLAAIGPRLVHDFAPATPRLCVALYAAIGTEPDLGPLGHALQAAGVPLALPVTIGRHAALVFRRWALGDPMAQGALAIAEPLPAAAAVDPDLLFIPLAAYDRRGQRIGYGAGHYDRSLAALRAKKPVRAIGVAFAVQEELFLPGEDHDQPLDLVVTDREILLCGA